MSEPAFISVTALNRYIYHKFDCDVNLQEVYLKGEISNYKVSGKHCYFSIKDAESELSAMFFYPDNVTLRFTPKDGMNVQVVGKVQVYQKRGTYAIIVKKMIEDGIGFLYQQFLDLKEKLQKEGLFDASKKLPLPEFPETVAIVTAPTGEAIHDILSTFDRRLPMATLKLYPALVQGADAPRDLVRALSLIYRENTADVIIIGRGGGSFEDLACFNDEALARTLASSNIPTISAVGHEGDYTICDFVASYRAPTPTGAAMRLTKDKQDLIQQIVMCSQRLNQAIKNKLTSGFQMWNRLDSSYGIAQFAEIMRIYEKKWDKIDQHLRLLTPSKIADKLQEAIFQWQERLMQSGNRICQQGVQLWEHLHQRLRLEMVVKEIEQKHVIVNQLNQRLESMIVQLWNQKVEYVDHLITQATLLNPFYVMNKGYSIVYQDNCLIDTITKVKVDEVVEVKMNDGLFEALVTKKEVNDGKKDI